MYAGDGSLVHKKPWGERGVVEESEDEEDDEGEDDEEDVTKGEAEAGAASVASTNGFSSVANSVATSDMQLRKDQLEGEETPQAVHGSAGQVEEDGWGGDLRE